MTAMPGSCHRRGLPHLQSYTHTQLSVPHKTKQNKKPQPSSDSHEETIPKTLHAPSRPGSHAPPGTARKVLVVLLARELRALDGEVEVVVGRGYVLVLCVAERRRGGHEYMGGGEEGEEEEEA